MTTPTHCCTGYLIAQGALAYGFIQPAHMPIAIVVSVLAANAPDVDALDLRGFLEHRNSPFHIPLYWGIAWIGMYIGASVIGDPVVRTLVVLAGLNILIHFIMDSIGVGYGIQWLAPFSKRNIGWIVGQPSHTIKSYILDNIKHPFILAEIPVWFTAWFVYHTP